MILTDEQKQSLNKINAAKNETILLYGVTGSGKTEVYFQAIAEVLKNG